MQWRFVSYFRLVSLFLYFFLCFCRGSAGTRDLDQCLWLGILPSEAFASAKARGRDSHAKPLDPLDPSHDRSADKECRSQSPRAELRFLRESETKEDWLSLVLLTARAYFIDWQGFFDARVRSPKQQRGARFGGPLRLSRT